ncbi:MAG: hypothetical protein ACTSVF_03595 [Candidatus Asgardarchaeia archaeon]
MDRSEIDALYRMICEVENFDQLAEVKKLMDKLRSKYPDEILYLGEVYNHLYRALQHED